MSDSFKLDFDTPKVPDSGDLVICVGKDLAPGAKAVELLGESAEIIARAAKAESFKGKFKSTLVIAAPSGLAADRLVVVGLGKGDEKEAFDWTALGATVAATTAGRDAVFLAEFPGCEADDRAIADLALGARLRSYRFDHYKSKKKKNDDEDEKKGGKLTLAGDDPQALKKAAKLTAGLAEGVMLARDLVNEPANALGPVEFAERAAEHRQKLADVTTLKDLLKESRSHKYLDYKAVDSAVRSAQAIKNPMVTRCPTVKCWIFKA